MGKTQETPDLISGEVPVIWLGLRYFLFPPSNHFSLGLCLSPKVQEYELAKIDAKNYERVGMLKLLWPFFESDGHIWACVRQNKVYRAALSRCTVRLVPL